MDTSLIKEVQAYSLEELLEQLLIHDPLICKAVTRTTFVGSGIIVRFDLDRQFGMELYVIRNKFTNNTVKHSLYEQLVNATIPGMTLSKHAEIHLNYSKEDGYSIKLWDENMNCQYGFTGKDDFEVIVRAYLAYRMTVPHDHDFVKREDPKFNWSTINSPTWGNPLPSICQPVSTSFGYDITVGPTKGGITHSENTTLTSGNSGLSTIDQVSFYHTYYSVSPSPIVKNPGSF